MHCFFVIFLMKNIANIIFVFCLSTVLGCHSPNNNQTTVISEDSNVVKLPEPYATNSTVKLSEVIGWPIDKKPIAPKGFTVSRFADKLKNQIV